MSDSKAHTQTWPQDRLEEVCQIEIGGTPARSNLDFWARQGEDGFPWVSISDMKAKYIENTEERITQQGVNNSSAKLVPKGTILMSFKLTIGKMGIAATDLYTNEAIAAFYPITSRIINEWLYHILPRVTEQGGAEQAIKGRTLSKTKLRKIKIPLPPLPEQRRIARILDTADAAIRETERVIAKLRQVKQGLLHDLLTRGLDAHGHLRDPEVHPEQFKASPLGRIPRGWETTSVGQIAETFAGGTPSRSNPNNYGGGIPWVKSSEINKREITSTEETLTQSGYQSSSVKWVPAKTPLIAMYGATAGAVSWLRIKAVTNQAVLAILPQSEIHARWLYWELHFQSSKILASLQGSGQPNLSKTLIDNSMIHWPSTREQRRIAAVLDAHDARIRAEEAVLAKRRQVKRGLMDDLLTGRVRVQT